MSRVSEMQYKVNEQRRLNNELRQELAVIMNGISSAYRRWNNLCNNVSNTLNEGAKRVNASQRNIDAAYQLQGEIDKMYILFKNIEHANKKIRECNNKKIYDFANYSAVRKIVAAILDNIETSYVSDRVLQKSIEVKHLQLPDYWLTCALLAIMAWKKDDKELAQRALERAVKLDKKEAAVFFMAFNLRIEREEAAIKWFEFYQSCDLAGEDDRTFLLLFSIVNRAVTNNCSDMVINKVNGFIKKVIADDMAKSGYSEEQMVARICYYLRRFIPNDELEFTVLSKYCKERDYLKQELMLAKSNVAILDFFLKTINITDEEKRDYLNGFIEGVVKKPNKVELKIEDEIKYNELIISHTGDIEAAKAQFEAEKAHDEEEFDIVLEMIDWLYVSRDDDVNPMVKANMLSITSDLNKKAVASIVNKYRNGYKTSYSIKIDDYEATANLVDASGECAKIQSYMEGKKSAMLKGVKDWISFIGFGVGVLVIIASIALGLFPLIALGVGGIIFGGVWLFVCSVKKKNIIKSCDNQCVVYTDIMNKIVADFHAYATEFQKYDSYAQKIFDELDKI